MDLIDLKSQIQEFFGNEFSLDQIANPQNIQMRINLLKIFLERYLNLDIERILITCGNRFRMKENAHLYTEQNNILLTYAIMGHHALMLARFESFTIIDITMPDKKRWFKILTEIVRFLNFIRNKKSDLNIFQSKLSEILSNELKKTNHIKTLNSNIENIKTKLSALELENNLEKFNGIRSKDDFVKKDIALYCSEYENAKKDMLKIDEKTKILNFKLNELILNNQKISEDIIISPEYLLEEVSCASQQLSNEKKYREDAIKKLKTVRERNAFLGESLNLLPEIEEIISMKEQINNEKKLLEKNLEESKFNISKELQQKLALENLEKREAEKSLEIQERLQKLTQKHNEKISKMDLNTLQCEVLEVETNNKQIEERVKKLEGEIETAKKICVEWEEKFDDLQQRDNERYDKLILKAKEFFINNGIIPPENQPTNES